MRDDSTIHQGLTPQAQARIRQFANHKEEIWQAAVGMASSQPFTGSLQQETALRDMLALTEDMQQKADMLVVIGTGGASLGARALCALRAKGNSVQFVRNCDAETIRRLLEHIPLTRSYFLVISKSGETVETLATILAIEAQYTARGLSLEGKVAAITEAPVNGKTNSLRTLAEEKHWPVLMHPSRLGGRFSVFSVVGMLPLAFIGLDTASLIARIDTYFIHQLRQAPNALFQTASWFAASLPEQPMHVLFAYGDRLAPLVEWYKQLWAESLGKDLKGPTPITAIGATDQHSQLQLYLGGPRDKLFTILIAENSDDDNINNTLPLAHTSLPALAYLNGQKMETIMQATSQATIETLRAHQIPLRVITQPFDVEDTALFMADYIIETLLTAAMLGVDPFTQPTVEEGKIRARHALGAKT